MQRKMERGGGGGGSGLLPAQIYRQEQECAGLGMLEAVLALAMVV